MRILSPPVRVRRAIRDDLGTFFATHHMRHFRRGMRTLCSFYKLPLPRVLWYVRLGRRGGGDLAGKCDSDGTIHLVHPEDWKRNRKYNTLDQWVKVVLHEVGHYYLWAESGRVTAEVKADRFRDTILVP